MENVGEAIFALLKELYPICRSITGDGVRQTLHIIREELQDLVIVEVPSGEQAFDWTVPREWNIRDAYIVDPDGNKIIDFQTSNLHVIGYSTPVNRVMPLSELQDHLYSLPDQPNAIPYITSYYEERWGFCLSHNQREALRSGDYHVVIDSELRKGSLTYGELKIPGELDQEVFLSTYVCHPSMANNELSGPAVTTFLAKWLLSLNRKYSYRIVFIPETIGSIVYVSRHLAELQRKVIAGFNVTCVGDDRGYSFLPSRGGSSLSDQVALHVLKHTHPDFYHYSFLDRGSDERQYCSPGVDLPVVSVMRSKYGTYPEYHTSLDDLNLVTPSGLRGSFEVLQKCIECIESNERLKVTVLCEPQLGKRELYPTLSTRQSGMQVRDMMNLIAYADGTRTLLDIADVIQTPMWELAPIVAVLKKEGLLTSI